MVTLFICVSAPRLVYLIPVHRAWDGGAQQERRLEKQPVIKPGLKFHLQLYNLQACV